MIEDSQQAAAHNSNVWRILGWIFLGCLIGMLAVGLFLAYGQPELLLEQMNLRYCG